METYSGREAIPAEGTLNITGFEEEDKSPVVKSLQSPEEMGSGYFGRATKSPGEPLVLKLTWETHHI